MPVELINQTRYRALIASAACFGLISVLGALSVTTFQFDVRLHQAVLLCIAVLCFAAMGAAVYAERRNDRRLLERIGLGVVALAGLALAEAVAWTFTSPLLDGGRSAFRPHFAFLPLYYLGVVALLPGHAALRLCWVYWFVILVVTVAGLQYRLDTDFAHDGVAGLLLWVGLGNPVVLFVLSALPRYHEVLSQNASELADLREQATLTRQLVQSERRFNLVVDGLQVGVWDMQLGPGLQVWCSERLYELTGYAPEDFRVADPRKFMEYLHPDDAKRVWDEASRQLAQGDTLEIEFRFNTRHRGYRWFNSRAKADYDAGGKLVRLAGAIADVNDRRSAEQALHMTQAELTRMAYRDTLTDLHNRRYFDEHFKREWERARRSRQPLTLMLIDLDYFKSYNDRYGHPAGDLCLVEVAHLLNRATSRATDILARMGGEEFGIVLPETTSDGAEEVADRIRQLLRVAAIPNEGSPEKVLTLSIGYSVLENPEGPSATELYEQADRALYEVKRRGRNGVLRFWGKPDLKVVPKESGA